MARLGAGLICVEALEKKSRDGWASIVVHMAAEADRFTKDALTAMRGHRTYAPLSRLKSIPSHLTSDFALTSADHDGNRQRHRICARCAGFLAHPRHPQPITS